MSGDPHLTCFICHSNIFSYFFFNFGELNLCFEPNFESVIVDIGSSCGVSVYLVRLRRSTA